MAGTYTCNNCGAGFPRFYCVIKTNSGWKEHTDSLVRHLLDSPECNTSDAARRKPIREKLREYYDELPGDYGDDCTPSFSGGYWTDPNDPTA